MTLICNPTPLPTGGGVMLNFINSATGMFSGSGTSLTVQRATAAAPTAFTTLYSGVPQLLYLDVNEGSPVLTPGNYVYQVSDGVTTLTFPITIANSITLISNDETALLIRLFEAAVATVALPIGIVKRPAVMSAMPLTGFPPLPILVINQDLFQQEQIPLGQQLEVVTNSTGNYWTSGGYAKFMWRISVLTSNPGERDFWKDAIRAIFMALLQPVYSQTGKNLTHDIMAACYQTAQGKENLSPGFYGVDVMVSLTGLFNVTIATNYGTIAAINFTAEFADGTSQEANVPTI